MASKFGTQTTKGVVILAYRNGDKHHQGEKLVLHPTKQKTFEQVLLLMTEKVQLPTGPVRRVYTPSGRPVKEITDFHDKCRYICCGAEKLNKEQMPLVLQEALARAKAKKEQQQEKTEEPEPEGNESEEPEEETPESEPEPQTEGKFGVKTEKGKLIKVYRNGDKHHEGDRFLVHPRKYKALEQLYADITTKVGVVTGPVRKLVYLKKNGSYTTVEDFDDIKDKTRILACGPEVPKVNMVHPSYFAAVGEKKEKLKAPVDQGGPVAGSARSETKHERFGTKTDKGRVIYVFRNGDKHDAGMRMVIHDKKYKRMDQVYDEMNSKVGVVTGAVRRVYLPTGKTIKSLDEFEDGCAYVCSGAEALKKDLFSEHLIKRYKSFRAMKQDKATEEADTEDTN